MLLCDTHADTLYALAMHPEAPADITAEKLAQGGVSAQTFALYVGGDPDLRAVEAAFEKMFAQEEKLRQGGWRRLDDYRDAKEGESAYVLSVEGCDLLDGKLDLLPRWRQKGVRMAALTWNYENSLGTPAKIDQRRPLTAFGREAAKEMQRLGIAPDTSHLSDRGFWDLMEMGLRPLASHSCCRALCDHPRNLTDDQLRALFEAGGYIGVNFYPYFLRRDGKADLDTVCDHVCHLMELGGEKHVGFGSDFDGIEVKPRGLSGPQDFPALLRRLGERGFTEDLIGRLAGENLLAYYDRVDPRG